MLSFYDIEPFQKINYNKIHTLKKNYNFLFFFYLLLVLFLKQHKMLKNMYKIKIKDKIFKTKNIDVPQ